MDIVYVDDEDNEIGAGSIQAAYEKGVVARIARVFLQNDKGEVLIQKRSSTNTLPGRWDQTAAGHVDKGETYEMAAYRELKEEMGITSTSLQQIAKYYTQESDEAKYVKKRFNVVFVGVFNGEPKIDNDEVSDYRWTSSSDLTKEMIKEPDNFTEGFIKSFEVYKRTKN